MSQCSSCGRELKPGAKFCGGCGTKIEVQQSAAAVCPSCGRELKPGAKFCGGCGTPIGQPAAKNAPQSTDTPVQTAAVGGFITWKLGVQHKRF